MALASSHPLSKLCFRAAGINDVGDRLTQLLGNIAVRELLEGGKVQPVLDKVRETGCKIIHGNSFVGQNLWDEIVVWFGYISHIYKYKKIKSIVSTVGPGLWQPALIIARSTVLLTNSSITK